MIILLAVGVAIIILLGALIGTGKFEGTQAMIMTFNH
jgi:hypothetical protein